MSSNKPNDEKQERYFFAKKTGLKSVSKNGELYEITGPIGPKSSMMALRYFKGKKVVDKEILFASPGIYTWLLRGETFYATEVSGKQEIGTLHSNLFDFSTMEGNEGALIAAGELEIEREQEDVIKIKFNLLSGTYYKKFIPLDPQKAKAVIAKLVDKVKNKLLPLKDLGVSVSSVEYIGNTELIAPSNLRTNNHSMEAFKAFFKEQAKEGGKRRTKRNKTKKRHLKNKKW